MCKVAMKPSPYMDLALPMAFDVSNMSQLNYLGQSRHVIGIPPRQKPVTTKVSFNWDEDFVLKNTDFTYCRVSGYEGILTPNPCYTIILHRIQFIL